MNIYISAHGKEINEVQLPILPENIELRMTQNNTSVIVHNFGEINLKGKRNLYSVSFESIFPHEKYEFCKCDPLEPYTYVKIFQQWCEDNETLKLCVPGTLICIFCTIEEFTYSEKDGTGDVFYTLSLKEYRNPYTVTTIQDALKKTIFTNDTVKLPKTKRISKNIKSHSYQWKKGDTWNKVAKKETGSSANGKALKKLNKKVINAAKKEYRKRHPKIKIIKEDVALIGKKVVIKTCLG